MPTAPGPCAREAFANAVSQSRQSGLAGDAPAPQMRDVVRVRPHRRPQLPDGNRRSHDAQAAPARRRARRRPSRGAGEVGDRAVSSTNSRIPIGQAMRAHAEALCEFAACLLSAPFALVRPTTPRPTRESGPPDVPRSRGYLRRTRPSHRGVTRAPAAPSHPPDPKPKGVRGTPALKRLSPGVSISAYGTPPADAPASKSRGRPPPKCPRRAGRLSVRRRLQW